jgi:hypothetical protein
MGIKNGQLNHIVEGQVYSLSRVGLRTKINLCNKSLFNRGQDISRVIEQIDNVIR